MTIPFSDYTSFERRYIVNTRRSLTHWYNLFTIELHVFDSKNREYPPASYKKCDKFYFILRSFGNAEAIWYESRCFDISGFVNLKAIQDYVIVVSKVEITNILQQCMEEL